MKVLQINTVYGYGSTGKIAKGIVQLSKENNIDNIVAYRYFENREELGDSTICVSSWLDCHIHNRLARITLLQGMFSYIKTKKFIKKIIKIKPDIIHLHNLHGNYINLKILFDFIKENNIPVVWTLHDCWGFTGQCAYFDLIKCEKWKEKCYQCPLYSPSNKFIDNVRLMFSLKKEWFNNINNMVLVTPSQWLSGLVKQSFLKKYPVKVMPNGIDLNVFKPTNSSFRDKYNLQEKKIILGVAFDWGIRKGIDVFIKLVERIPDNYKIVLVGTNDRMGIALPDSIITINKTNNQRELAEIYTAADVFVNPTREEVSGTVNLESLACGTPVITFNTGGSPECIDDKCGCVVEKEDIEALINEIKRVCESKPYRIEDCLDRAKCFDMNARFRDYVVLYKELYGLCKEI